MHAFRVVSDLICPWCYIGKRRLEAALRDLPSGKEVSVSWHAFQLNPEMPSHGMDRKEYCMRKFGSWDRCEQMYARISEVGRSVGLEFRFDLQPVVPNTLDAHRVIWLAGRSGLQDDVVEALFRGFFCEGMDLADRAELIEAAVSAGLERADLERLFHSRDGIAEVEEEDREIKALGVSSVPLFIIYDHIAVSGAQPSEAILRAFEEARRLKRKHARPRHKTVPPSDPRTCDR